MRASKTKLLSILVWALLICSDFAFSSSDLGNFRSMTVEDGLNNNTINDIHRGKNGFIWFATDRGLSRYDGFHFRNFPYNTVSSQSLFPKAVKRIYQGEDDLFYLLLGGDELMCFDREEECYLPISFNMPPNNKKIKSVYVADKEIIYLAMNDGLYYAEVKRTGDRGENIELLLSAKPLLKGNVTNICGDGSGNLFLCIDEKRVVHYSMGTRQMETVGILDEDGEVTNLEAIGDYLWIGRRWKNVACYDFKRKIYRVLTDAGSADRTALSDTYVTGVTTVEKNTYYLSTGAGLYRVQLNGGNPTTSDYTIDCLTSGQRNSVKIERNMTSLLWDNTQKMLWVGTFGGGAAKMAFNESIFNRVGQQIDAEINGMVEDAKGYVWLATNRKGVWKSNGNLLSASTTFTPWTKGVDPTGSYQVYKDKNGNFWLGDEKAGVLCIDPIAGEVNQYWLTTTGGPDRSIGIRQFCLDARERLWVATSAGLILFDNRMKPERLHLDGNVKEIYSIVDDKEGNIWLGTDRGLKRVELKDRKVSLIGNYEEQAGFEPTTVYSVYVNSYNQIFASYDGAVIRVDGREKDKMEMVFTLTDGLSSGHIDCMVDDQNGNTWVGSNSGIMTIRNDRTSFYDYSLSGNYNKVCRLRDGRLLWADSWGLMYFDPLTVKNKRAKINLIVSDLWVNGKSVAVGEKINGQTILLRAPHFQEKYVFNARNNDFCFYLSDMQYGMMQRKIAYRLLPNETWQICSLGDGIRYTQLSGGKYTLQVKLIYPDASEGEVLDIPIVVREFWWKTGWAIMLYVLLLGGALAAAYYFLTQKGRRKIADIDRETSFHAELGQMKSQNEQDQEAAEVRNLVLGRFMQELRMPLSMIIAPIKEVLQEKELSKGLMSKILVVYRNSISMLNACDQLLAIYGQHVTNNRLEIAAYSLEKLVDSFVFSINEFLRVHPIEFQYEKKVKKDREVWIDKKKIEFILHNLLSNAFIHIRYSGAIVLMLQETEEEGRSYFVITVVDNGKGEVKKVEQMKEDIAAGLHIDSAEVELGFEVMERIVQLHHGSITLSNVKGGGTKIQVKCPMDKSLFDGDANVEFVTSEEQEEVKLPDAESVRRMVTEEELNLSMEDEEVDIPERVARDKKTLLIVEDYKDIRIYLKTIFDKEYNILLAVNGAEGVELAKKELPDLVISDVMMPVKDGFECCREIKEGLDTCHIPVILLTAKVEDDDIIKGLETGADDYVLKPFTAKILKAKVKNLIEGRSNLKQMYSKLLSPIEATDRISASGEEEKEVGIEDPFISTVVKIIEENIQEPDFNVKRLASDLNMSQPTLYRRVKQCTDFTIIELIRGVRMRKAAILLKQKQNSVQEVAEMVGYNDIPTFRKHFVDAYGKTPSTYASSEEAERTTLL